MYSPQLILKALVLIPCAIGQVSHGTSYYKWVDEQGTIQYTQAPPPQKKIKFVVNSRIPSDSKTVIKNLSSQNNKSLEDWDAAAEMVVRAKVYATAERERRIKNAPQCQKYRDAIAQLKSVQRMRTEAAHGDRGVLTEAQKENKIQQNMDQIEQHCL